MEVAYKHNDDGLEGIVPLFLLIVFSFVALLGYSTAHIECSPVDESRLRCHLHLHDKPMSLSRLAQDVVTDPFAINPLRSMLVIKVCDRCDAAESRVFIKDRIQQAYQQLFGDIFATEYQLEAGIVCGVNNLSITIYFYKVTGYFQYSSIKIQKIINKFVQS